MKTLSKATYPRQPHGGWDDQGAPLPAARCTAGLAPGLPLYRRCQVPEKSRTQICGNCGDEFIGGGHEDDCATCAG